MKYFFLLLSLGMGVEVHAQADTQEQAILKPISNLFLGMHLGDSAMVRSSFTVNATMASIGKDKAGNATLRRESSVTGFLKAVGSPHNELWSEPIWDTHIKVDGDFAQVWTNYAFYLGKRFNHCGVDAFQLIKQDGVWRIFHLTDTRQTEDCDLPASITNQFK